MKNRRFYIIIRFFASKFLILKVIRNVKKLAQ